MMMRTDPSEKMNYQGYMARVLNTSNIKPYSMLIDYKDFQSDASFIRKLHLSKEKTTKFSRIDKENILARC